MAHALSQIGQDCVATRSCAVLLLNVVSFFQLQLHGELSKKKPKNKTFRQPRKAQTALSNERIFNFGSKTVIFGCMS